MNKIKLFNKKIGEIFLKESSNIKIIIDYFNENEDFIADKIAMFNDEFLKEPSKFREFMTKSEKTIDIHDDLCDYVDLMLAFSEAIFYTKAINEYLEIYMIALNRKIKLDVHQFYYRHSIRDCYIIPRYLEEKISAITKFILKEKQYSNLYLIYFVNLYLFIVKVYKILGCNKIYEKYYTIANDELLKYSETKENLAGRDDMIFKMLYLSYVNLGTVCDIKNFIPKNLSKYAIVSIYEIFIEMRIMNPKSRYTYLHTKYINEFNSKLVLNYKIYYNKLLLDNIKECSKQTPKKFVISSLKYVQQEFDHALMFIYNPNTNEVEIYDPQLIDENTKIVLTEFVQTVFPKPKPTLFSFTRDSCQYVGLQTLHQAQTESEYADNFKQCATWTLAYTNERVKSKYLNMPAEKAYTEINNKIKQEYSGDLNKFISKYITNIKQQREKLIYSSDFAPIEIRKLLAESWNISPKLIK